MGHRRLQHQRPGVGGLPVVVGAGIAGSAVSAMPSRQSGSGMAGSAGRMHLRPRGRMVVVFLVAAAVVTLIAMAGLGNSLIYYRTPTGLLRDRALIGHQVRVGGLVEVGSLREGVGEVRFILTDGVTALPVIFTGQLVGVFQPGQDALVQGTLNNQGVFLGTSLVVKHSNVYRAADGRRYRPPHITAAKP